MGVRFPLPQIGSLHGRLRVLSIDRTKSKAYAVCLCACGRSASVRVDHLRSGRTASCGCWHDEAARIVNTKHGHKPGGAASPEYRTWSNLIDRCYRTSNKRYKDYGGAGVRVCDRWRNDFEAFLSDVGPRPEGCSIDRIDPAGDYAPGNVRWADRVTQARNVRNKKHIHAFGRSQSLAEWADEFGIDRRLIHNRINRLGWTSERAIGTAVQA